MRLRLKRALHRLFEEPEKILEIGIRQPPRELEKSRQELQRFFRGTEVRDLEVPDPGDASAAEGSFPSVSADLEGLTLLGMRIQGARFVLEGLGVDPLRLLEAGELRIIRLGSIFMSFLVEQEALNEMTEDFQVSVEEGTFVVRGRRKILILPVGFRAAGRLAFTEAGEIFFHDQSMSLGGLPLPGFFRSALRRRINPIFDLHGYLGVAEEVFRVRFLEIEHLDGALRLSARAEVDLAEQQELLSEPD